MSAQRQEEKEVKVQKEGWFEPEGELVADVWETKKEIVIQAPIASTESEDIEIIVEGGVLKIKGQRERPAAEQEKEKEYLLKECYFGPFSKEISLPEPIDKRSVKATIEKGVLTIRLPKKEGAEKKIEIEEK